MSSADESRPLGFAGQPRPPPITSRHREPLTDNPTGRNPSAMSANPDPRTSPTQIPRGPVTGQIPQAPGAADACVNFNLLDGRVVCLSVPIGISEADGNFIITLLQAHVSAVTRRGR